MIRLENATPSNGSAQRAGPKLSPGMQRLRDQFSHDDHDDHDDGYLQHPHTVAGLFRGSERREHDRGVRGVRSGGRERPRRGDARQPVQVAPGRHRRCREQRETGIRLCRGSVRGGGRRRRANRGVGGFDCDADWLYAPSSRTPLEGLPDKVAMTLAGPAAGALIVGLQHPGSERDGAGRRLGRRRGGRGQEADRALAGGYPGRGWQGRHGRDGCAGDGVPGTDGYAPGEVDGASNACVATPASGMEDTHVHYRLQHRWVRGKGTGSTTAGLSGKGGLPASTNGIDGTRGPPQDQDGPCGTATRHGRRDREMGHRRLRNRVAPLDRRAACGWQAGGLGKVAEGEAGEAARWEGSSVSPEPSSSPGTARAGRRGQRGLRRGRGNPGTSGGSSIGLISLGGDVLLQDVRITPGTVGRGGAGGPGQPEDRAERSQGGAASGFGSSVPGVQVGTAVSAAPAALEAAAGAGTLSALRITCLARP